MEEASIMKRLSFATLIAAMLFFAPQMQGKAVPAGIQGSTSADPNASCPTPPAVVATVLGLTPGQVQQFGTLLSQVLPALQTLQKQGAATQQQLDTLLGESNPDPAQIGKLVVQLHAIAVQTNQVVENFHNAFAGLLSQEQLQKLQSLAAASQVQPIVGAFVALYLVPPPPALPTCQGQ
jgi:Spy/CpxP family protein refolding chaperone